MIEKEVKLRILKDVDSVEQIIVNHGFKYIGRVIETDTYFQHPCRDFSKSDEALRLRETVRGSTKSYTLTYKGPKRVIESIKYREEVELSLNDVEKAISMLNSLGFRAVIRFSKLRKLYSNDVGTKVSIDHLCGVGLYLEIEGNEDEIAKILKKLNNIGVIEERTYLEICFETKSCTTIDLSEVDMCMQKQ